MKFDMEYWPISRLSEYEKNPRIHDVESVNKLAQVIREFGFRVPIVAKSSGLIVDGHMRLAAAKVLGLEEVPVLQADDLTDSQIRAFRLAVNRMAELAEWDLELLAEEIQGLDLGGFDLEILGFSDEFLSGLLDGVDEGPTVYVATPTKESHADHAASAPKLSEQRASFADKNKEIDVSTFDDEMDLKIRLSFDDYHEAKRRLLEIDDSLGAALKKLLKMG